MRKPLAIAALAAALTLALFVPRGSSAPALVEKPVRYEYAELRYSRTLVAAPGARAAGPGGFQGGGFQGNPGGAALPGGPGMPAAPAAEIRTAMRWTTGEEEVEVKEWEELADRLKAPAPKRASPATVHKLRVLNKLSADGWELMDRSLGGDAAVAPTFRDRAEAGSTLTFRRLVR